MNEADLLELLESQKHMESARTIRKLLVIRREKHRDKLEREENPVARGRARECKYILELLS